MQAATLLADRVESVLMADTGNITERPVGRIFREMATSAQSGVLRLNRGKQARAVVFEKGAAVFAVSNAPEHQLDALLVGKASLTREQAAQARAQIAKETELGRKLIDLGMLDSSALESAVHEQVERILHSILLWHEGEYVLDTSARAAYEVPLRVPMGKLLVEAGRKASAEEARVLLGPPDATFVVSGNAAPVQGAVLTSVDGFLLSRISHPMTVEEICEVSGVPEEQTLPMLYALVAAGFVERAGDSGGAVEPSNQEPTAANPNPASEELSIDELRQSLDQTLSDFRMADHYEVLGISRDASFADVKKAYYALAKKYHPDRHHMASETDIRAKLESIFASVSRAYETLKDSGPRTDYDSRLGPPKLPPVNKPSHVATAPLPVSVPPTPRAPRPPTPAPPSPQPAQNASAPLSGQPPAAGAAKSYAATAAPAPPAAMPAPEPQTVAPVLSDETLAEQMFQQGMRRYENQDLLGAIQLWQEAVRKNPNNGTYRMHLGTALAHNARWHREAEKHLLEASKWDPRNTQVLLTLGALYTEANLKKRAEAQYRAVLALDPNNQTARRGLVTLGVAAPAKESGESTGGLLSKFFKKK
jgi:tetratricopeptide (TPR) repeat protein